MTNELHPQAAIQDLQAIREQMQDLHGCILSFKGHTDEEVNGPASVMQAYLENMQDIMGSAVDTLEVFVDQQVDGKKLPQTEDQTGEV